MATAARASVQRRDSSREPDSMGIRIAGAAAFAAAIASALIGLAVDPSARGALDRGLVVWALIAFISGMVGIAFGRNQPTLSMDLPLLLACAFVLGPIPAALVALVASADAAEFRGEVSVWRALWNRAQVSFSVLAAGIVFGTLGGEVGEWPRAVVCALIALAADALVNYGAVALMLVLVTGHAPLEVVRRLKIGAPVGFAFAYTGFGLTGLLMAETFTNVGYLGLFAFIAPLLLARQAFSQTLSARAARQALEARREALRQVDERIADERRDERRRVADTLHDDVLQSLYSVSLRAQVIREAYRSGRLLDLENEVPDLVRFAEAAVGETRDLIGGLRSSRIGHSGLVDTLALLVGHMRDQSAVRIVADLDIEPDLNPECELLVYQIAREALTNAIRHSGADTIWVSLREEGKELVLCVLDNGGGFDPAAPRPSRHFGLELMEERALAAHGSLDVRSARGNGTTVEVRVSTRNLR
jgi:signal transduction histidine kinase